MAANKFTRHGNGAGYGGPAKGKAPNRLETIATHAPFTPETRPTVSVRGPWATRKAELAQKAMDVWEDVIDSADEPAINRMKAASEIMNRVDGMPVQKIVTPDSAPEWFIEGTIELSEAEWTETARLATSRPAGNAD